MVKKYRLKKRDTSPIFKDLADLTDELFWKNLLTEMSSGYFKNKLVFKDDRLFHYAYFRAIPAVFSFKNKVADRELLERFIWFLRNRIQIIPDSELGNGRKRPCFKPSVFIMKTREKIQELLVWNYVKTLPEEKQKPTGDQIFFGFLENRWTEVNFRFHGNKIVEFLPDALPKKKLRIKKAKT